MSRPYRWPQHLAAVVTGLWLAACGAGNIATPAANAPLKPAMLTGGQTLRVVATTSIIGDVVHNIGGDDIDLTIIIQAGQDPHSYEPVAADTRTLETAHLIFANGHDLEESLRPMLAATRANVPVVEVSDGVDLIRLPDTQSGLGYDPHTWQDPTNVIVWADNIRKALAARDPAHAAGYTERASDYQRQLTQLDIDLKQKLAAIPDGQRKLVTNHDALAYFARRYQLRLIGTVYLGADNVAEPSAGQMADLVKTIRAEQVHAIFVETTVSPALAQTIAEEVGYPVKILTLYTDALDKPGTPGDSYIGMMRANAVTIVSGLGE